MYMCMGQGGTEVCTCVCVREEPRFVHVFVSGSILGVYVCMGQRGTEEYTSVWVREELRFVHVCGSESN